MPRPILEESRIHPAIRGRVAGYHQSIVQEVMAAVAAHAIVVVGMSINPIPASPARRSTRPGRPTSTSNTAATSATGAAGRR